MNVEQLLFHLTEHVIYHVDPNQGFRHLVNPQLVPETVDDIVDYSLCSNQVDKATYKLFIIQDPTFQQSCLLSSSGVI